LTVYNSFITKTSTGVFIFPPAIYVGKLSRPKHQ